jgi:diguanylate cyclase (GGDEF)-like protein/PAS domain S-box-containing protein
MVNRLRPGAQTAWAYYSAAMVLLIAAYLFVRPFEGYAVVVNILGVASVVALVVGVRMHGARARTAWSLLALGQLLYVAGDFYTYTYPDLLGGTVGFPSAGDAIYLSVYPALFAGLMLLIWRRDPGRRDRAGVLDSLVLTVGFGLLFWVFLIAPNVHLAGLSVLAKGVSAAYPVGDVLLLAALIRFSVQPGSKPTAFYILFGSTAALLLTDCAYNYALLHNTYNHQLVYDAGWLAYLAGWGAAALHPSMRELEEPLKDFRPKLTRARLMLLGVACLISPAVRFVLEFGNPDILVVVAGSAILFLLVVLRVSSLARQEERTAARETDLREAGQALVEAVGRASVNDAAVTAATRILGGDAKVRLVLWDEPRARVLASNGAGTWDLSPEADDWLREQLMRSDRVVSDTPPEPVAASLGFAATAPTLAVGLSSPEQQHGALLAQTPLVTPQDATESLGSLASQVSLALEAASLAEDLHREKSEARFRSLVAHSSDLITVLDAEGLITYQSPSIERLLGHTSNAVEGMSFLDLVMESDRTRFERILDRKTAASGEATHTFECALRHADGRAIQFEVQETHLLDDEHVQGIVLNSRDVSERKAFEEQLSHQAFHDPVTGLANRALFVDRVAHALRATVRKGVLVAVMFIDLDDFKTVNDSLGHQAGDAVLAEVASRLERAIRPADTVARFGGDEFAVLLDGVENSDEAALVADRLLAELEAPTVIDRQQVYPRASIGICMSDEDLLSQDAEELLRNADVAMYMAKRGTKGRYQLFEPAMHERVVERLELRTELESALERGQLEVYYQPVVRLANGSHYGVEALLRWHHPVRGLVLPVQFIPLAEETGLIVPIGRWVLNEACNKAKELHSRLDERLRISINLSVKQLQSESIVHDVREALESSGIDPSWLVLEVTETVMLADADVAVERLHALKQLGVWIAMDDFGTGYSSLSYLSRLPVDILKMDRSFLSAEIGEDGLAAAIMAIGERLGLEVVAEGVEHPEQIDALQSLGFGLGQGYYFGRPMPATSLDEHLARPDEDLLYPLNPNAT